MTAILVLKHRILSRSLHREEGMIHSGSVGAAQGGQNDPVKTTYSKWKN
jgi:hypothetical protein